MADDLIRKSDVLETYADLYDIFDDNKAIQEELHKVFDKINDIPSVEPNCSEKPNNCEDEPQTKEPPMDEYYRDHDEFYDCDRYVITNDEGERAYNCIGCQTDCPWK